MHLLRLTALLLLACTLLPGRAAADTREAQLQQDLVDLVSAAREELRALDGLVDAAGSRSVRRELHRKAALIDEMLADIPRLANDLERAAGGASPPSIGVSTTGVGGDRIVVVVEGNEQAPTVVLVGEEPDEDPVACSTEDFNSVVLRVAAESFDSGKLELLADATVDRWYTAAQVRRMLEEFSFDRDKIEAAVVMHPRVVDMKNWFKVHDAFSFDSSKEELRRRVGR